MSYRVCILFACGLFLSQLVAASDWPQGGGPKGDFVVTEANGPTKWSVVRDENIAWRLTLPETGQSPVVVSKGQVFFSHYVPAETGATVGRDVVACSVDAQTGEVQWKRKISGRYNLRLSGCFSDSTSPPAVADGERVCFINASGDDYLFRLSRKRVVDPRNPDRWANDSVTSRGETGHYPAGVSSGREWEFHQ